MREDWNRRAKEDAFYYVAFGRRQQNHDEFLATAADAVRGLEYDLARLPSSVELSDRKALEIGCGPGRLMGFMSRHFGEIHGVDVSDEMIRMARRTPPPTSPTPTFTKIPEPTWPCSLRSHFISFIPTRFFNIFQAGTSS